MPDGLTVPAGFGTVSVADVDVEGGAPAAAILAVLADPSEQRDAVTVDEWFLP
jgi:hypothetical protein